MAWTRINRTLTRIARPRKTNELHEEALISADSPLMSVAFDSVARSSNCPVRRVGVVLHGEEEFFNSAVHFFSPNKLPTSFEKERKKRLSREIVAPVSNRRDRLSLLATWSGHSSIPGSFPSRAPDVSFEEGKQRRQAPLHPFRESDSRVTRRKARFAKKCAKEI